MGTFTILFLWESCIKIFLFTIVFTPHCRMQWGVKLQIQITPRSWSKDEKILGCELEAQVGTSDGKNRMSKIWRYCLFKQPVLDTYKVTFCLKGASVDPSYSPVYSLSPAALQIIILSLWPIRVCCALSLFVCFFFSYCLNVLVVWFPNALGVSLLVHLLCYFPHSNCNRIKSAS
jgi:hypothetical protein